MQQQQQQLYLQRQRQMQQMQQNNQCQQIQYQQYQQAQQQQRAKQELQQKINNLQRQINRAQQVQYQYQQAQLQQAQQMKMRQQQQQCQQYNNNNNNNQCQQNQNQNQSQYPYQQQYEQEQRSINNHSESDVCNNTPLPSADNISIPDSTHSDSCSVVSSISSIHSHSRCSSNNTLPSQSPSPSPSPSPRAPAQTYNSTSLQTKYKSRASSKLQASLRWIIYNDQIDDYADMLCINDELKIYVINQCSKHSATHSACIKWSKKWNLINHPQCKQAIFHAMSQSKINNKHKKKKNSEDQQKKKSSKHDIKGFHDLPICQIDVVKDVIFVNNNETLKIAKQILSNERRYIGLDLECVVKEFPIKNAPKYCQILQVATSTKTIVFDLQSIPSKYNASTHSSLINPEEFDSMLYSIFYDSTIIKIGMSFDSDLKLLRKQYPYLKCFKCIIKSYFELEKLLLFLRTIKGQELFNVDICKENLIKRKLSKTNTKREGGLPTIVRHILGERLLKKEQLSNWARRPLRISQLQYSAIDAKIQLTIYDKLQEIYSNVLSTRKWIKDLSRY